MSFWISVYDVDAATGERKAIDIPSSAGGFHSWGHEVYASSLATELGLSLLPRLATEGYFEVEGADIERIRDEAKLLHAHADRLRSGGQPTLNRLDADGTRHNVMLGGPPEDDVVAAVRSRLENIIAAADIALALGPDRGRLSIG
jgi:hypothetical protein